MKFLSLIGALVAGAIGAVIWAAVSYYANVEIGYIAWGIGLLVGFAAHALGAEGIFAAIMCAGIALVSMLGGKALATHFAIDQAVREEMLPEAYKYTKTDADAFQSVSSDEETRDFMVKQQYTAASTGGEISDEELAEFKEFQAQPLLDFHQTQPSMDEWIDSAQGKVVAAQARSQFDLVEGVKASLGPFDLIFGLLGISTAFKMAMAEQDDESVPTNDHYGPEYGNPDE